MTAKRTVLVVEDDATFAETAALLFRRDFEVVIAYASDEALEIIDRLPSMALALIDLNIPGPEGFHPTESRAPGLTLVNAVRRRFPDALVAALTGHVHPKLINAVQAVGGEYIAKEDCRKNLELLRHRLLQVESTPRERLHQACTSLGLTRRQAEVVALAAQGLKNDTIAHMLGISPHTLKHHVGAVLSKTGESSLRDFIARLRATI